MRKMLFVVAVCSILTFPVLNPNQSGVSSLVYAGHSNVGNFCECGCPGCICDPGEQATSCLNNVVSSDNGPKKAKNRTAPSADMPGANDFDLGSGALLVALALLMLRRMWF